MKFVQKTFSLALLAALLLAMPASYAPPAESAPVILTQPAPFNFAKHRNVLVGTGLAMIFAHPVAQAVEAYKSAVSRDISRAPSLRERLFASFNIFASRWAFAAPFKDLYKVFAPEKTRDMKTFSARGKDFLRNHKAFSFFATAFFSNIVVSGGLYRKHRLDFLKINAQKPTHAVSGIEEIQKADVVEAAPADLASAPGASESGALNVEVGDAPADSMQVDCRSEVSSPVHQAASALKEQRSRPNLLDSASTQTPTRPRVIEKDHSPTKKRIRCLSTLVDQKRIPKTFLDLSVSALATEEELAMEDERLAGLVQSTGELAQSLCELNFNPFMGVDFSRVNGLVAYSKKLSRELEKMKTPKRGSRNRS